MFILSDFARQFFSEIEHTISNQLLFSTNTSDINYIDINLTNPKAPISYLYTKNTDTKLGYNNFDCKSKQTSKVGKFITLAGLTVTSTNDIQTFAELVTSKVRKHNAIATGIFEVVGEDIRYAFLDTNYACMSGQLGNSCMRYTMCQPYLDIYVFNPNQISLAVSYNTDNKLTGRCLIWTANNGEKYYDRIYSIDAQHDANFVAYCKAKGYVKLYKQNLSLTITLDKAIFNEYPYIDSMSYLDENKLTLSTNSPGILLKSTNWKFRKSIVLCEDCNANCDKDSVYTNYINGIPYCDNCCAYSILFDDYIVLSKSRVVIIDNDGNDSIVPYDFDDYFTYDGINYHNDLCVPTN